MTQMGDNSGGKRPADEDRPSADGPRSPWRPESPAPRRSAGLDDILRSGTSAAARPHWLARFGGSPRALIWQVLAGLAVVWLVGLQALFMGVVLLGLAWRLRRLAHHPHHQG